MSSPELNLGEPRYSFGDFTLDVKHRVLRRRGEDVILRAKSFEVLVYLVEHHGRLATKAELLKAVWENTAVTDNSLAQCIVEIRRALDDDPQQLVRTVARQGYIFTGPVPTPVVEIPRPQPVTPGGVAGRAADPPATSKAPRHGRMWSAMVSAVILVGFSAWWVSAKRTSNNETPHPVPFITFPGVARYPSFSPDGNHVAFTWTGPKGDNPDVYIQQIAGQLFRLTSDPANEFNPVWSPDGRWVAFLRREWGIGKSELRLISPLGGPERLVTEIRVRHVTPPYLTWCAESNCLVVTDSREDGKPDALFAVSLESGDKIQLTYPQHPALGDTSPAISPDGSRLVFRRQVNQQNSELYQVRLRGGTLVGEPHPLTEATFNADTSTWTPDSKEILFSTNGTGLKGGLWRMAVAGELFADSRATRLAFVGEGVWMPVVSRPQRGQAARLAYVRSFQDVNIWRVETPAPGVAATTPPTLLISSTRQEAVPQFSEDGRRVAFASDRSGEWEIWVADADGANPVQLTSMKANSGAPCWSPDGKQIVFQSNASGQYDIYMVAVAGGKPRNLTSQPATDGRPSFSRDGKSIYFHSNRTGQRQIFKMPASGGAATQVTNNGGFAAFESWDGAYVYYNQQMDVPSALWRVPTVGGDSVKVLDGVVLGAFAIAVGGIYYVERPSRDSGLLYIDRPAGETRLQYFDFVTGRSATVARNLGALFLGLTASPDGRSILYSRIDSSVDDLMLVENFR